MFHDFIARLWFSSLSGNALAEITIAQHTCLTVCHTVLFAYNNCSYWICLLWFFLFCILQLKKIQICIIWYMYTGTLLNCCARGLLFYSSGTELGIWKHSSIF